MQRVTETNLHGALDDEELFVIEGVSCTEQQKTPQTAKNGALVEIMSRFQRANRAERNCNQKHRLCTLLHSNRMEAKRLRIRVHRNVENAEIRPKPPVEHVSTVEPSSARVQKNTRRRHLFGPCGGCCHGLTEPGVFVHKVLRSKSTAGSRVPFSVAQLECPPSTVKTEPGTPLLLKRINLSLHDHRASIAAESGTNTTCTTGTSATIYRRATTAGPQQFSAR